MKDDDLQATDMSIASHIARERIQLEPEPSTHVHEIGLYGEVLAPTQAMASAIANCARVGVLHGAYPGQVATAGNFASPGNPLELAAGPVCEFTIYHLMDVEDSSDFPIEHFTVGDIENKQKLAPKTNPHHHGWADKGAYPSQT